ncbi:MAG: sigma-70 family RNA polymerase sigma factor [Prevotella sp.]|nr:sigma-70 family RNA polymerase sigma factor [Prevotella sp.]
MAETNKLITENLGYVITLARQYKSEILSTDDLINEGTIGMMRAAQKFDPSRGKPFVTFAAPYIRQAIEQAIGRLDTQTEVRSTDESLPRGSRNNYTLLNVLEDTNAPRADANTELTLSDDMLEGVSLLDDRQQAIIRRYFGIGRERQTMAEIGAELGLKRERVRQIRNKALRKLHHFVAHK